MTHKRLPAAAYSVTEDLRDSSIVFIRKSVKSDDILKFKDGLASRVIDEVESFWSKQELFRENGFLHRRGYLFYGNQGTGKSSIVWQIAQDVVKRGGVVFVCDKPAYLSKGLATFRQVEPSRPVVCVFEDIDAIIEKYGESEILSILDGDNQVDGVVNVATTNYPEKLNKRIVSRPRRFDRVHRVDVPSDKIRIAYLENKLPKSENKKKWIKLTEGLSFAGLTEALISVLCLGNDLEDAIEKLRKVEEQTPKIPEFTPGFGFGGEEKNKESDD